MTLCINPKCPKPADALNARNRICRHCGSELILQGRYRVKRLLGVGGFAKTYEIDDRGLAKVLKVLQVAQPKAISLFRQEAAVLQRLRHPGIPRVEPGGYFTVIPRTSKIPLHCLVMQKIQGQNLEDWLQHRGNQAIDQDLALDWLLQLARILHEIHQLQYFHRDIKPSNIMLQPNGQLALIDFGSVREVSGTYLAKMGIGHKGTIIASKGYAPSEQENGHPVPQSDFFGLGRTFVHLLTGRHPLDFYDPSTQELSWRQAAPEIHPNLAEFIDYLMARLPGQRPQKTEVILQLLAELDFSVSHLSLPALSVRNKAGNSSAIVQISRSSFNFSAIAQQLLDGIHRVRKQFKKHFIAGGALILLGAVAFAEVKIYQYVTSNLGQKANPAYRNSDKQHTNKATLNRHNLNQNNSESASGSVDTLKAPDLESDLETAARDGRGPAIPLMTHKIPGKKISLTNTLAGHSEDVRSLAISPDGKTLASGSFDGTIKVWNLPEGKLLYTLTGHSQAGEIVSSVAISPNGNSIISSSNGYEGSIKIWNLYTGELRYNLSAQTLGVSVVAISPDGRLLATGSNDGTVWLWSLDSGDRLGTLSGHFGTVDSVAFSPDGTTLASGSQDGSIKLWSLNSEIGYNQNISALTLLSHIDKVHSVAFSPDGKTLASGSADNSVKLWDATTGKLLATLLGNGGTVYSVAISPDGNLLAGGSLAGRIKLWDLATRKPLESLSGHSRWVESIAFSPDGHTLASGSGDRTIKIWGLQ